MSEPPLLPSNILEILNERRGGFNELMGLSFTHASYELVEAEVFITSKLHQPYGLVHGGVYAAIVETLASTAAALNGAHRGVRIVGLENSTSFLRATREGLLRGRATPLTRGRRTHVWEVAIHDDDGKLAATGRVRLLAVEAQEDVQGQKLTGFM